MRNSAWYSKIWHKKLEEIPLKGDAAAAWQNMNTLLDQQLPVNSTPASTPSSGHTTAAQAVKSIGAKIAGYLGYIIPAAAIIGTTVYFAAPGSNGSKSLKSVKEQHSAAGTKIIDTAISDGTALHRVPPAEANPSLNAAAPSEIPDTAGQLNAAPAIGRTAGSPAAPVPFTTNQSQRSVPRQSPANAMDAQGRVSASGYPHASSAVSNRTGSSGQSYKNVPAGAMQSSAPLRGKFRKTSAGQTQASRSGKSQTSVPSVYQNQTGLRGQYSENRLPAYLTNWTIKGNTLLKPGMYSSAGIDPSYASVPLANKLVSSGNRSPLNPHIPDLKKPVNSRLEKLKAKSEAREAKRLKKEQLRAEHYAAKIKAIPSKKDKVKPVKEKSSPKNEPTEYGYHIETGINASKKSSFYGGAFGSYALTPHWSVGAGLRLNTARSFSNDYKDSVATQMDMIYTVKTSDSRKVLTMDIPLFISYKLTDIISIKGGPVISFPVKQYSIKATYIRDQTDSLVNKFNPILKNTKINSFNAGFSGGLTMQLKRFGLDAQYLFMSPYQFNNDLGSFRKSYQTFQLGITYRIK